MGVYVSPTAITEINNDSTGTVVSYSRLNTNALNVTLQGAGTFNTDLYATQIVTQLSGAATTPAWQRDRSYGYAYPASEACQLETQTASTMVEGVGSAEVTVTKRLERETTNTGSVVRQKP